MFTFGKQDRLLSPIDFKRVYERKCSVSNQSFIVYGCANALGRARLGLSVSRKFGNAVARNRFKRLCREAFRLTREELPQGFDFVILPRSTKELTLELAKESLLNLTQAVTKRLRK